MWNWGILGQSGLGPKQKFYFGLVLKLLFKLASCIFIFILIWNCISSFSLHWHTHHHWSLLLRPVAVRHLLQPTTHPSFPISFSFSLPPSYPPNSFFLSSISFLLHLTANQQHHACRCRSWRNLTELTMPAVAPIETHTSIFNFFFKKNNKKNKGWEKEVILNKSFKKGQNAHLFG